MACFNCIVWSWRTKAVSWWYYRWCGNVMYWQWCMMDGGLLCSYVHRLWIDIEWKVTYTNTARTTRQGTVPVDRHTRSILISQSVYCTVTYVQYGSSMCGLGESHHNHQLFVEAPVLWVISNLWDELGGGINQQPLVDLIWYTACQEKINRIIQHIQQIGPLLRFRCKLLIIKGDRIVVIKTWYLQTISVSTCCPLYRCPCTQLIIHMEYYSSVRTFKSPT